jgi:transaldolase
MPSARRPGEVRRGSVLRTRAGGSRRAADLFQPVPRRGPTASTAGSRSRSRRCSPMTTRRAPSRRPRSCTGARKAQICSSRFPARKAGLPGDRGAIFAGVPVNVTLLFSREQYLAAAEAYLRGVERRIEAGLNPRSQSVASVFVSRWDVGVQGQGCRAELRNRLGIAIAMRIYKAYRDLLDSPRWLRAAECRRAPATPALGQHRHQGSEGAGHAVREGAGGAGHREYDARVI